MKFLRKHWYDVGGGLAVLTILCLGKFHTALTDYQLWLWLSLISLFLHQLEEYRIVGTFPGTINKRMFKSAMPDRYPLNTQTAFIINVGIGWTAYVLAAILAESAVWLGIATILVSFGNLIAHTLVFNIKGKTIYNAGLATCWLFFAPCIYFFVKIVFKENIATLPDVGIGIVLGVALNWFGVLKLITWLANKNTPYIFEKRNLLPEDRS